MENSKVYAMPFARVYPLLVNKAVRKNRTEAEVRILICRLCGYTEAQLDQQLARQVSYETFFKEAPAMHPGRMLIKGSICGIRVQEIQEPLMREIRILDKLIDDLAKGKEIDKILPVNTVSG